MKEKQRCSADESYLYHSHPSIISQQPVKQESEQICTAVINPSTGISFLEGRIDSNADALLRQKLPNFKKKENTQTLKQRQEKLRVDTEETTATLKLRMEQALQADYQCIIHNSNLKQGEKATPAINRLMLLSEVDNCLRKKPMQIEFLQQGGLQVLANWISQNPDGNYPLAQVIEKVFEILEYLPVESRHLEHSKVVSILAQYSNNRCHYPHLENRALNIIQHW